MCPEVTYQLLNDLLKGRWLSTNASVKKRDLLPDCEVWRLSWRLTSQCNVATQS